MGIFRMLFATSVFINHSFPIFGYTLLGPDIAVRSFFIVSGFYMGLILNEKYLHSYWLFLSNRLLRIYPLYLVTLVLVSIFTIYWLHTGQEKFFVLFLQSIEGIPFEEKVLLSIDEILRNITLIITAQATTTHNYLLVNQGWTLQLEVLFYLVAPFIVRKTLYLFLAVFISLVFRHIVTNGIFDPHHTLHNESMVFAFLQMNIFFLLGALAYKGYAAVRNWHYPHKVLVGIYIVFIFITLFYPFIVTVSSVSHPHIKDWIYYISFLATLPFLFLFTKNSKIDSFIGSLSYPFYIIHYLILEILVNIFGMNAQTVYWTIAGFICSIIASVLLLKILEPLEVYRKKRVKQQKKRKKL